MKTPIHESGQAWEVWYPGTDREVRGKALCDVGGRASVGVGLMQLEPGSNTRPAHWHTREEEHLYALAGEAELELGDRKFRLVGGSYVCFPAGQEAAHCLINHGPAPFVYLMIGERIEADHVVYPGAASVAVHDQPTDAAQPPAELVGERVTLRRAVPADAVALFRACDDAEVMRFLDWPRPTRVEETRGHLEKVALAWARGEEYQWVAIERATGELVGTIAARPRGHAADFGYFFARAHWGRGLASECARLVVGWLAEQPSILRIWATADADNLRSRRVLEGVGLRLEGVMRMASVRPNLGGLPRDTAIYARCRGDA